MTKTLPSGATLEIQLAPFEAGCRLLTAVTAEAEKIKIDLGGALSQVHSINDLSGIDLNSETVNTLKNIFSRVIASESIRECFWECSSWAIYNKTKITKENNVFDKADARGDFLIVMKEVLMFNLSPFFSGLVSMLPAREAKSTSSQG
jgi:hypothetical protein